MLNRLKAYSVSAALASALLLGAAQAKADIVPANCGGANASDLQLNANTGGPVQVDQVIEYQLVLINPQLTGGGQQNCRITNASASIRLPNGSQFGVLTNISLDPGQSIICPGNPICLTNGFGPANFGFPYTVQLSDLVSIDPTLCPPPPGPVTAISARAFGSAVVLNGTVNGAKNYQPCANTAVSVPCISCTKICTNGVGENGVITFGGTILNCGSNSVLVGITASNFVNGTLVPLTLGTNVLGTNQITTFSGSYTNPNPCAPITDTILVRAVDRDTGQAVSNSCVATCTNILNPSFSLSKQCVTNPVPFGADVYISGTLTNTGNVTLTNIIINDNQPVNPTRLVGPITLAPGGFTNFIAHYTPANPCAPFPDTLTATASTICGIPLTAQTATTTCNNTPPTPQLVMTKICPATNGIPGGVIGFSGTITNTGNVSITNIVIVNNQPAANTAVTTISRLDPGQGAVFSGTEPVPTNVCAITDILSATGHDLCNNTVAASATNTCPVLTTPRLAMTKSCPATNGISGGVIGFSGTITNTGNVSITNIVIVNNQPAANTPVTTIARLDPGQGAVFSGTEPVPANVCSLADTVTATAHDICGNLVTTDASATCPVLCAPLIKVWKQVVCYTPQGCETFDNILTNQHTAFGVRVDPANCPAFCYRIIVTNLGNVTLTNVTVVDDSVPNPDLNLTTCFPAPFTLAAAGLPGSSATCIVTNVTHCSNTVNIVTAAGTGPTTGTGTQTVTSTDTNNVVVAPISINCNLLVSTDGGANFSAPSVCATQVLGSSYIVRIVVTNTGQYALQNVTVSNVTGLAACLSVRNVGSLAVGASTTIDCTNVCASVGRTDYAVAVSAVASQSAGHVCDFNSQGVEITAQSQCSTCVVCTGAPSIKVYKQVVCYTPTGCESFDSNLNNQKNALGVRVDPNNCPAFCYRIVVTNTGNITLTNVTVVDDSVPNPDLNLTPCAFPSTLAVGASASCIVTNVTHCSNTVNVVTATGVGFTGTQAVPVSAQDTNNVVVNPISVNCTLTVSTNGGLTFFAPSVCATQIIGGSYVVRIAVTNTGSYALQNVTVSNVAGLAGCLPSARNIGSLPIGAGIIIDCTNTCAAPGQTDYTVDVTGEASQAGSHVCDHNAQGIQIIAHSTCRTCVVCFGTPCIGVTKGIACVVCTTNDGGGVILACASATGGFEKEAFGVRSDTQDPAFCYQIVVTNCGNLDLNVAITDEKLGLINVSIGVLAPGATFTTNIVQDWHVTTTNTVIANGVAVVSGQAVSATNFAIAHIRPASIACAKFVSVDGGPFQQTVTVTNQIVSNLVWSVTVTNTGQADLQDVTITDLGQNDLLPCQIHIVLPGIFPVGATTNLIVCSNSPGFTSCVDSNIDNDIRVVASAAAEGTNCVWDINGTNIMVQTSCDAHVRIICVLPNACRVTGGGRQDAPLVCPADVRYVTHGGQVGAPVGNSNCVVTLDNIIGNPCIHGRWTHVRHAKGGLEGNFHARFYDTLDCVCLATTLDSTGLYDDGNLVNGTCNPGDRISGPEPRKAPANKIIFTGVGDWADPNGRRAPRATLFRVDIEDRGEPGGSHPGGAKPPADRYRIRIWVLSDVELAALNNPTDGLLPFRNAIAACHGAKYRDGVFSSELANNCGGPGSIVFPGGAPVRLPDIDDGGELLHGNHQIHPSIMSCDPANPKGPGLAKP